MSEMEQPAVAYLTEDVRQMVTAKGDLFATVTRVDFGDNGSIRAWCWDTVGQQWHGVGHELSRCFFLRKINDHDLGKAS